VYTDPGAWHSGLQRATSGERASSALSIRSEGGASPPRVVSPRAGQLGGGLDSPGSGEGRSLSRIASLLEARRRPV
jgi:hypothetical protein